MYCTNCGYRVDDQAVVCPHCGVPTGVPMPNAISQETAKNDFALIGFILAFFTFLPAIILSIIGLVKAKQMNGNRKGLAIAGIVIPLAKLAFVILMYALLFFLVLIGIASTGGTAM